MNEEKIWQMSSSAQEQYVKDQSNIKKKSLESGFLAKIWGTKHSAANIAGVVCIAGLVSLLIATFCTFSDKEIQERALQIAFSLISLSLGYIFGNYQKNDK